MQTFDKTLLLVFLLVFTLGGAYLYGAHKQVQIDKDRAQLRLQIQWPYKDITIQAKAAFISIPNSNLQVFARRENAVRPLASLTKIMTSLVSLQHIPDDTQVQITNTALAEEGDLGLVLGENWNIIDLEKVLLVPSSNDAAMAIRMKADELARASNLPDEPDFITKMNAQATELGLTSFHFLNESGLDLENDTIPGSLGSAKDVSRLFALATTNHSDIWAATREPKLTILSSDGFPHEFENTDTLTENFPELLASKTGFTDLAGGNLTVLVKYPDFDDPVVITVLGSSREGRFVDVRNLFEATHLYLQSIRNSGIPIEEVLQRV